MILRAFKVFCIVALSLSMIVWVGSLFNLRVRQIRGRGTAIQTTELGLIGGSLFYTSSTRAAPSFARQHRTQIELPAAGRVTVGPKEQEVVDFARQRQEQFNWKFHGFLYYDMIWWPVYVHDAAMYRIALWLPIACLGLLLCLLSFIPLCVRRLRRRKGLCVKCGYDLRGPSALCPECGHDGAVNL